MAPPIKATLMKHVGAPAMTAVKTAVTFGGLAFIGVAFVCIGIQSELSRWMSEGAAAILIGATLLIGSYVFFGRNSETDTETATAAEKIDAREPDQAISKATSSIVSSKLNEVARTAFIGLVARRPITMLGVATAVGAAMLAVEADKNTRAANGRMPA